MYKIVMIAGIIVLAIGWGAYGIWRLRVSKQEKNQPKKRSQHLEETQQSLKEYAEKMKSFKKPTYKREDLQR